MKFQFLSQPFFYLCLFVFVGCTSNTPTEVVETALPTPFVPSTSPTEPALSPTSVATSTPTEPTLSPTSAATSTATPSPTPTATSIATPIPTTTFTPTPLPTLSPEEAEVLVLDLLQNNAGCQLPCWWGTIPGQTTWQETEAFLTTFALDIAKFTQESPTTLLATYEVRVKVPENIHPEGNIRMIYSVRDDIVEDIGLVLGHSANYLLPEILSDYGEPTEVWINTYSGSREGSLPFRLMLFYLNQGFGIEYYDEADETEAHVVGCFHQPEPQDVPFLFLWSPQQVLNFREVLSKSTLFDEEQFYLPLEEATGMNVKNFYETFKDTQANICLETPSALWQ